MQLLFYLAYLQMFAFLERSLIAGILQHFHTQSPITLACRNAGCANLRCHQAESLMKSLFRNSTRSPHVCRRHYYSIRRAAVRAEPGGRDDCDV